MKNSTKIILIVVQLVIFIGLLVFLLRGQRGLSFITQLFTQRETDEQVPIQIQPSQVPAQNSVSGEVTFDTFGVEKTLINGSYVTSDKEARTLHMKTDAGMELNLTILDSTFVGKAIITQNPESGVSTRETAEELPQNTVYSLSANTPLKILYFKGESEHSYIAEDIRIY